MKFIPIEKSKGLVINKPVFTINEAGNYGLSRLKKIESTEAGTVHTFESATFTDNGNPPSIAATLVTNITHVAIIKS